MAAYVEEKGEVLLAINRQKRDVPGEAVAFANDAKKLTAGDDVQEAYELAETGDLKLSDCFRLIDT